MMLEFWVIFVCAFCLGTSLGILFGVYISLYSLAQVDESKNIIEDSERLKLFKKEKKVVKTHSKKRCN